MSRQEPQKNLTLHESSQGRNCLYDIVTNAIGLVCAAGAAEMCSVFYNMHIQKWY